MTPRRTVKLLLGFLALLPVVGIFPAFATERETVVFPGLEAGAEEPVLSTGYAPRPTSRIAENVTVVTADDIARINAHTLSDVLQTIPGIQFDQVQTPGSGSFFNLLAFQSRHILVRVDGVPQNFLSAELYAATGSIPAQQIERVEIIKGAASAAWGSALSGVVNVITKSPESDRSVGGMASASGGERGTTDLRGELSGTANRFGYYLTGGNLHSQGLSPGTRVDLDHAFGKWTYDLPRKGDLDFGLDYRSNEFGLEESVTRDYRDSGGTRHLSTWLMLKYPLADRLSLSLDGHVGERELSAQWGALTVPDLFMDATNSEKFHGANLRLDWGARDANLTAGLEYEHDGIHARERVRLDPVSNFDLSLDRWSAYLNGSYTLGRLTVLPGVRLDHSNLFSDAYSYTLGATLRLGDATLLRGYAARGYGLPMVNNAAITFGSRELQNVVTAQTGIESGAIPGLWVKGTLFYNDIWKVEQFDYATVPATVTLKEQTRQGFELEARTLPIHGFALAGGYTGTEAWDRATGATLGGVDSGPSQGAKVALHYENAECGMRGALTGNYVWWNQPADYGGHYKAMTWDLHLTRILAPGKALSPELFFSARNLFNGSQYGDDLRLNARRWVEGGMRLAF